MENSKKKSLPTIQILKQLDWEMIFDNTSQYENLYEFLIAKITLEEFCNGFYPKSKNKRLIKNNLNNSQKVRLFKKHAKKIWNLARICQFSNGDEMTNIKEYLNKL